LTPIAHISAGVGRRFLLDSFVFHRPPSAETLGVAVGLSLLPDLDAPLVAALKGELAAQGNGTSITVVYLTRRCFTWR